tara:strand:- start:133 stop:807 length:675 start_codon:yes stop_codon:yes gene_type:complete
MKKYLVSTSLILSSIVAPSFAEESKDFYLKIGGGIFFPSDLKGSTDVSGTNYEGTFNTKNTGVLSVGFGKEFNDYGLQFEYSKAQFKTDKISVTSGGAGVTGSMTPDLKIDVKSYMIYGLKEFNNDSKFTPYAGIGLGLASLSAKDQTVTLAGTDVSIKGNEKSVFSYALRGGAEYEIADNTSIYSEATYQNFASYKVEKTGYNTVNYDSTHIFAITAGLKFNF